LKKLTDIVWPEIQNLVNKNVELLFSQGNKIIVVEAALLIDANWHSNMNEIWVSFVPDEEAIERSMKRDNSNIDKVKAILNSQMTNVQRIKHANVVFCSLWNREYTINQVKKAWGSLLERTILNEQFHETNKSKI
jgi:phosphopantetheine adenylyltransferase/dephospho-CoA kinase